MIYEILAFSQEMSMMKKKEIQLHIVSVEKDTREPTANPWMHVMEISVVITENASKLMELPIVIVIPGITVAPVNFRKTVSSLSRNLPDSLLISTFSLWIPHSQ